MPQHATAYTHSSVTSENLVDHHPTLGGGWERAVNVSTAPLTTESTEVLD